VSEILYEPSILYLLYFYRSNFCLKYYLYGFYTALFYCLYNTYTSYLTFAQFPVLRMHELEIQGPYEFLLVNNNKQQQQQSNFYSITKP